MDSNKLRENFISYGWKNYEKKYMSNVFIVQMPWMENELSFQSPFTKNLMTPLLIMT